MVLTRWSPFTRPTMLPSLFEDWLTPRWSIYQAPLDGQRTGDGYHIETPLPGFKPEDIEITLEKGLLTISAKRSEEKKTERGQYLRREVYSGSFMRRLSLPSEVKPEDIVTSFENGMLTVDVKHVAASDAVKIPVAGAKAPELPASSA